MASSELRIVMVGKTGAGKSSTGNTILQAQSFEAGLRATSVTSECSQKSASPHGFNITVVDTPGLFDTSHSEKKIIEETTKCVTMLAPGPHAFLIVVGVGRFTKEEQDTVQKIQEMFGADVGKYAIVVFTRKDELLADGQTIDDYVENAGPELTSLLYQCGGRYHAINNRRRDDRQQVTDLLKKVEALAQENNTCYSSALFQLATKIKEKEEIITNERKKSNNWALLNSWIMKQNEEIKALQSEIRRLREKQKGSCTIS